MARVVVLCPPLFERQSQLHLKPVSRDYERQLFPQGKVEHSYQNGRRATKSWKAKITNIPDNSGSQSGAILLLKRHLSKSKDICDYYNLGQGSWGGIRER